MKPIKPRPRSKQNRSRPYGNVVNRVFESSGPEGKVRGTPQQIIDKYIQFARDAQLSNDRVAAENYQQHAEHYTRLLAEAQREQEARREHMREQQQNDQQPRDDEAPPQATYHPRTQPQPQPAAGGGPMDMIDLGAEAEGGPVETPESRSA